MVYLHLGLSNQNASILTVLILKLLIIMSFCTAILNKNNFGISNQIIQIFNNEKDLEILISNLNSLFVKAIEPECPTITPDYIFYSLVEFICIFFQTSFPPC